MMYDNHEFEYKCRRCGSIFQGDMENDGKNMQLFLNKMEEDLKHPPLIACMQCGKRTVHDVISYSGPEYADNVT